MLSNRQRVQDFLHSGPKKQEEIQRAHIAALAAVDDTLQQILAELRREPEVLYREVDLDMPK